jgi:methylase of polypeptide subunit release factors
VDFFNCDIPNCDYIISNPPYSRKGEVLQKLFDINKPSAMFVGVVGLFESQKRFDMFKSNCFEILYMNRRIAYFKDYNEQKPSLNPPFSSVYVCSKMLPKQIVFEEINKAG